MATKTEELGQSIVAAIRVFVAKALSERDDRIEELERRLSDVEMHTKDFRCLGVWEAGREYGRGNVVTDRGSLWHCQQDTSTRPGHGNAWTLAVKRGADGRSTAG